MRSMGSKWLLIFVSLIITIIFISGSINLNASLIDDSTRDKNRLKINIISKYEENIASNDNKVEEKNQLSFAAFADTHIGARYQYPYLFTGYKMADHLDKIGDDLVDATHPLDFAIHLGDIVNHNTGHVNGIGLPWYVNQYKNNLKLFLISHVNLAFHCILGNHDLNDYEMNPDDPHKLTKSLIDELSMNSPVYAMMRDGILFLIVPELGYVQWTHPVEYEWVEYMTQLYPDKTTIILTHQAIEDTTEDYNHTPYRGKQDIEWWTNLFKKNPQIKMWIHGHNHYLDWYVSDQSNGETYPIQKFGHEIAFSAPYSQMDLYKAHEEDRIVIYIITSTGIRTATWENNGFKGHWISEYIHSWDIPTTYNPDAEDWYAFSMFLQDNETQFTDMKLLSPYITLQLIGTAPMELFYDSKMESSSGWAGETILGFGDDNCGNVEWTNPGMKVYGPTKITFPEKYPYPKTGGYHEDGRSGPPYRRFPMGTICAAVPGQIYNFTMTARCISGNGRFSMSVDCSDWGTRSQYSTLLNSKSQVFSHVFGSNYETITGKYTVPNSENAWFLQGKLNFIDSSDYEISLFSVKREQSSHTTDDFHLFLSGKWYNVSGSLSEKEMINFSVDPTILCNKDGIMNFTASIGGNKFGLVNLIYHEPVLLCRNARFRVNSFNEYVYNLSLTKTISKTSKFFEIYPFSTDSIYNYLNIKSDDNSGVRHVSKNGNIWLTCNLPTSNECNIEVSLYGGIIKKPKQKLLYIFDNEIGSTLIGNTVVIGKINIEVNVIDIVNVSKVEFYIDGVKQYEINSPPYEWVWNRFSFFKYFLMVKTYYTHGYYSEDKINLWKFF
jgi:hypothetical protein